MKSSALVALIVIICTLCITSTSAFTSTHPPNSEYDIQSLIWEHDAIYNGILEWALEKKVLTPTQANILQQELEARLQALAENEGSDVDARRRIYSFISTRLSVPSLLSGFGLILLSIITLGAVLFFMDTPVVTVVSVVAMGVWWWISSSLGQSVQWQVLGVCIFVIPAALVGTAAYGLLIAFGLPATPYEFLLSEVSTIIFSVFVFYKFGFTFLLVPALVAGYFMWVDITCILMGKKWRVDQSFFTVTLIFGLVTTLIGSLLEREGTYLGFWFLMVGGFTFVGGFMPFILMSSDLMNEVLFLTCSAGMIYAGTTIQRSVLLIYGGIGVTIYVIKSLLTLPTTCNVSQSAMYMRALFSVLFFSLAAIRYSPPDASMAGRFSISSYSGFAEYGCGFWLLVLHTLTWAAHVARWHPISGSSHLRSLSFTAHLLTTIGLAGLSRVMKNMNFSIIHLVYEVDCGTIVAFVAGCGLVLNHCSALILDIGAGLGITNVPTHGSYHPKGTNALIRPGTNVQAAKERFAANRLLIIVLVGLLSNVLPSTTFARSSVISLLFLSWVELIYKSPNSARKEQMLGVQWLVSCCAFLLSHFFALPMLEWACFACLIAFTHMASKALRPIVPLLLLGWAALGLALDSALLQASTTLLTLEALLQTAKFAKRRKMKVLHTIIIVLTVAIAALTFHIFLHYDFYRNMEHGIFVASINLIAQSKEFLKNLIESITIHGSESSHFSLLHAAANFVAWPLPLSKALIAEGDYVLTILILIGVITAVTEGVGWTYKKWFQETPIDENTPALMSITQMTVHFPDDTGENGIVIGLKGDKPEGFEMENATLHVIGDEFWSTLSTMYGSAEIEAFRKHHYPFKLFPNRLSKKHFNTRDEDQMWFHFGTSLLKEPAFSQSNIRSTLRKLVSNGDPDITIQAIYSSRKYIPKKALLFEFDIRPGLILNSIRERFQLKPLLADW